MDIIILTIALNTICFLIFLKSMLERECNIPKWLIIILFTGPIGIALYLTFREKKKNEELIGRIRYRLGKNFILPWSIYTLLYPILLLTLLTISDLSTSNTSISAEQFISEMLFWTILIYIIIVIPFLVIVPVSIAGLIMLIYKPK